ncbi:MAG: wax ester/triacylglycerol synthase family O-acyltransferase [Burkholderiales bacterium]|nr:wax ester/triacylglycerol synthase family O-acyltransferase [Burkholderiales bacterium]
MRQLSAHDAGFLYSDTSHSNANVTLIQIYDQSTAPGGKVRFKSILAHIESRLSGLPIFRSKLQRVPLDLDHPYWVDDPNFDLEYHVRHIALPKPGDWRQFCIQASRIHARPLDLNRPLWEIYVVEGLDSLLELPAGSFALLTKIHHAAVDAEGGSRIAMLLHDLTPQVRPAVPPKPWFPQRAPGTLSLLLRGCVNSVLSPLELRTPWARKMADSAEAAYVFASDLLARPEQILATRFNSVVSAHRVFDTRRFLVEEFDAICSLVPGASLNDAVLAVCGGALRGHLLSLGELPDASLSAVMPQHAKGPGAGHGGSATRWLRVQLGTELADPVQRLLRIHEQTAALGADAGGEGSADGSHQAAATLALSSKMQSLLSLGSARRAPSAACTVTNVAGPSVPLYLNGARMTYFSAIMPIADGMGLVFAVTSYDGRIIISPTSCRELLPDPEAFTQQLRDSFQAYLALARAKSVRKPRSARPRASAPGAPSPARPKARRVSSAPRAAQAGRPRSAAPAG